MENKSRMEQIRDMRRRCNVCKLITGVDRLDYTKGIPQKIAAMEHFLKTNPHLMGQVSMIQVAVPSRQSVQDYKDLATDLHRQVEALNRKYGSNNYKPVHLLHQSVPFDQLMTMYAASDICFVSSIRDERKGVLLLSEFAGAAEQLTGSVLFNPWDTDGTVEALRRAVTMDASERSANQKKSEDYVLRNSSSAWGKSFLSDLKSSSGKSSYPAQNSSIRDFGMEIPM
ncbi:Trehalose-6-P synthase/phosphatase complex synthase subunit [Exophiala xenobiotica]|nr:Trehalose-6-P synthase/phosphatase complex synthase subunit [Exophiala xenobiotica]